MADANHTHSDRGDGELLHALVLMLRSHNLVRDLGNDEQADRSQQNVDDLERVLRARFGNDVINAIKNGAVN